MVKQLKQLNSTGAESTRERLYRGGADRIWTAFVTSLERLVMRLY
jgi:hypothetical protein